MSKGLKTCATIWTAVLGIGSFVGACILWSNADGGYYYNTDYDDSKIEVQEDQYAVRPAMWISLEP